MRTEDDSTAGGLRPPAFNPPRPRARTAPAAAPAAPPSATHVRAPDPSAPDLPGCRPMRLRRRDLDTFEGRFEYWDGATETAWVMDPTGLPHERPSERLAGFCALIAAARGSPIECCGSTDLELRDEHGRRQKILQADQCVYVYPARARLPRDGGIVVGEHDFPDVVLEVDHTTDVRRWKLGMFESWGFPEVWVEVPDQWSRSRARNRLPGLTIHVLEGGRYRESPVSPALPEWRARAIHDALNEAAPTGWTHARLERVGRVLGERDGTGPDDHPLMRSLRDQSRAEGERRGRAEGERRGRAEGEREAQARMVRQILRSRGIGVSAGFPADAAAFAASSDEAIAAAALACSSERDFLARLDRALGG